MMQQAGHGHPTVLATVLPQLVWTVLYNVCSSPNYTTTVITTACSTENNRCMALQEFAFTTDIFILEKCIFLAAVNVFDWLYQIMSWCWKLLYRKNGSIKKTVNIKL